MIGVDGGSDSWLIRILNRIFQCSHRCQSRPITPRGEGQAYAVCLDCGTRLAYDLSGMRAGASALGINLDRQTSEIGKEDMSDIPERAFISPAPRGRERMSKDSRRFHLDFGTTAVVCIGAMSLTAGLIYSLNRPARTKNLTTQRPRPTAWAKAVKSPNLPAQEDGTEGVPPQETAPANLTVSTEPISTTGGKTIDPESISPSVPLRFISGLGRLEGNGSVIVLGREAGAALELFQYPERLSELIRRGSLFTVPSGTWIKLLQSNRFAVKVRIMEGSMVGQEGWAQPGQARPLSPTGLVKSSPSLPVEHGTKVMPELQTTKLVAKATASTVPTPAIEQNGAERDSMTASAAPPSNSGLGRFDGNGSVIVLGREAVAAVELSQHPERLSKLIQNGSLFTVPRGTAIKLVQGNRLGNRLVVKVLIMNGSNVGQEGWAKTWPVSP